MIHVCLSLNQDGDCDHMVENGDKEKKKHTHRKEGSLTLKLVGLMFGSFHVTKGIFSSGNYIIFSLPVSSLEL